MKLSEPENALFFDIVWPLQLYACQKLGTIPGVDSVQDVMLLDSENKLRVRDAVFDNPGIIGDFATENPAGLDDERLSIARSWRGFVKGDFYIERYLEECAIFIHADDVYAVLGLRSSFDKIFPNSYLPMHVEAVLLPFRDKIVYDGFMRPHKMLSGSGIKSGLEETYMNAKRNGQVMFSLAAAGKEETAQSVDWSEKLRQLMEISGTLEGGPGQPALNAAVFALIRASIELGNRVFADDSDPGALFAGLDRVEEAAERFEDILHQME